MLACALALLAAALAPPVDAGPEPTDSRTPEVAASPVGLAMSLNLEGSWRVTRYVFEPVGALTKREAAAMLGKRAQIKNGRITFAGETCTIVHMTSVDVDDYLYRERTNREKAGLTTQRGVEIDEGDDLVPDDVNYCYGFLVISDRTLVAIRGGVLFFLTKENPRPAAPKRPQRSP
jgi:hypothetical protein